MTRYKEFDFYISRTKEHYPKRFEDGFICIWSRFPVYIKDVTLAKIRLKSSHEHNLGKLRDAYGVKVKHIYEFLNETAYSTTGVVVTGGYIPMFIKISEDLKFHSYIKGTDFKVSRFELMDI